MEKWNIKGISILSNIFRVIFFLYFLNLYLDLSIGIHNINIPNKMSQQSKFGRENIQQKKVQEKPSFGTSKYGYRNQNYE